MPLTATGLMMRSTASYTSRPVTSHRDSTDANAPSTSTRWYLRCEECRNEVHVEQVP